MRSSRVSSVCALGLEKERTGRRTEALGARYFTQLTDAHGRTDLASRFNNTSAALGLLSLLASSAGGVLAFLALR